MGGGYSWVIGRQKIIIRANQNPDGWPSPFDFLGNRKKIPRIKSDNYRKGGRLMKGGSGRIPFSDKNDIPRSPNQMKVTLFSKALGPIFFLKVPWLIA